MWISFVVYIAVIILFLWEFRIRIEDSKKLQLCDFCWNFRWLSFVLIIYWLDFCCFELSSLKIPSNDFFIHFVVRAKIWIARYCIYFTLNRCLVMKRILCRYFYNGILHQCYILKHGVLWHFDEWEFTDITFWCRLFWCDFDVLKLLSLWLQ